MLAIEGLGLDPPLNEKDALAKAKREEKERKKKAKAKAKRRKERKKLTGVSASSGSSSEEEDPVEPEPEPEPEVVVVEPEPVSRREVVTTGTGDVSLAFCSVLCVCLSAHLYSMASLCRRRRGYLTGARTQPGTEQQTSLSGRAMAMVCYG